MAHHIESGDTITFYLPIFSGQNYYFVKNNIIFHCLCAGKNEKTIWLQLSFKVWMFLPNGHVHEQLWTTWVCASSVDTTNTNVQQTCNYKYIFVYLYRIRVYKEETLNCMNAYVGE